MLSIKEVFDQVQVRLILWRLHRRRPRTRS
jgi:hypothetical protein